MITSLLMIGGILTKTFSGPITLTILGTEIKGIYMSGLGVFGVKKSRS